MLDSGKHESNVGKIKDPASALDAGKQESNVVRIIVDPQFID
jgi:hypothetical protein